MNVSYARQTTEAPNPLARFAHRARLGRAAAVAAHATPKGGALVDFGAGSGAFLASILAMRPDIRAIAIEPYMTLMAHPATTRVGKLEDVPGPVDCITALEVCEHLSDQDLDHFVTTSARMLAPGGALVVSVPIMLGPVVLMKELNRVLLHRRRPDHTVWELLRATLTLPVTRHIDRAHTHKGFDFRSLRARLEAEFTVSSAFYSPLPAPYWLNSQAFFVCRPKPSS